MGRKPAVLVTGISGNLGMRLSRFLNDFEVVGVDMREPADASGLVAFEKVDLSEERSCDQLLDLMNRWRPEAVAHLAFVVDPLRAGVIDHQKMWNINVDGTGRVIEAIAEYNRSLGGIHKFIFPSSVSAYGPDLQKPARETTVLRAHTFPYALHKRETDMAVQIRAASMKCRTYILRPAIFTGPTVQNFLMSVLRGRPGGQGWIARKLRDRDTRLPLVLPMGTILNVAGRGDLDLKTCAETARIGIRRLPGRAACKMLIQSMWKMGISDVPPEALPYLLGSFIMDTTRLVGFLGEDYKNVIQFSSGEALAEGVK